MNKKNGNPEQQFVIEHGHFTSEEDDPGPPPPNLVSTFSTLEEWLSDVCDKERPSKPIEEFNFSLFEGEDDYTLCLTGVNTYQISKSLSQTRIEFEPKEKYFLLPADKYQGMKREQVLARLSAELKSFAKTDKFKGSFLRDAKSVTTSWNGENLVRMQ